MNLKNKELRNSAAIHRKTEPAGSSRPSAPARTVLAISGVALCMSLASCVSPVDTYADGSLGFSGYRPGYTVDTLPRGYRTETISGSTYHYHDGQYYRPDSGGYVVVEAPRSSRYFSEYSTLQRAPRQTREYIQTSGRPDQRYQRGAVITSLPRGYRRETISGNTYYYNDGSYYRQDSGGYVIVEAPRTSRYYDDYRRQVGRQPNTDYRGSSSRFDQRYQRGETITRLPDGYREVSHRGNTYYQTGDRYYQRQGESYIVVGSPF